ncbi:MAG: CYTH-like domain-containing protein [Piptocephalis tieghemiana]|nr:MAG: CYTH-like domain-containing protein [Piptocephalis tieghemiana]
MVDSLYSTNPPSRERTRTRVTREESTGEIIPNGIVRKTKLAEVNVYCPSSPLDYRITISQELPTEMPNGIVEHTRRKDRLSYVWQHVRVDLTQVDAQESSQAQAGRGPAEGKKRTHELEVELSDTAHILSSPHPRLDGDSATFGKAWGMYVEKFHNTQFKRLSNEIFILRTGKHATQASPNPPLMLRT